MTANQCDIGLIGLAVMGENLVLNMESKGFSVSVFNRTTEVTEKFAAGRGKGKNIQPARTMEEFVGALKRPRKAMIMVKAGAPVDAVIGQLAPLLEKGDVIIDGGNSLFTDTQLRCKDLEGRGIHFVGCGVSGGEEGALKGPSLMPGGSRESWEMIAPIFRKIAAQVDGEPCCRYLGPDGAGHYVKMVHNGIEYGDMQLICEAYAILKNVLGLDAPQLAETFTEWNKGELDSYLIEITSQIFRKLDPDTGKPLVDVILDKAGQKGTGIWTLQSAIQQSVVISTINAAVEARVISSRKDERVASSKILPQPKLKKFTGDRAQLVDAVRHALYASKIVSYAQGMELLSAASAQYKWNLNFGDIATIWRGGCIIRAKFLNCIVEAYERDAALHNLLLDRYFTGIIEKTQDNWRVAVAAAVEHGVAVPAFSASLAYFDSYRQARLPSNLLQAQRDFFGAHTYERVDKPGVFHTEWIESDHKPKEKPAEAKPPAPHHAGE
ncbi:MAG: phosphogluconate dehydrogenase (NADP(+)-dependent, decarboxylating) [Verrucomicrobia bacterium]|nr:MAG: phosphogluconate dehydrogenase (NADP(+)-dependent, decarboxylating) [Verrucomicrobiota bacterium]PYK94563.1 MAG: phosphogluconate dehydrogenase (NADP(+)-dependent, decarboxylating) [Verrucomicrobiota bacterium]